MTTATFTDEEFWMCFGRDLEGAQARVIIQSPFVTTRRIKLLAKDIRAVTARGTTVCVFVQEPRKWDAALDALDTETACSLQEFKLNIELLESWGVHVNLRRSIHAKFAVIDESVLWEGSLNILSHNNTREHMRRWQSKSEAQASVTKHSLARCSKCELNKLPYGATAESAGRLIQIGNLLASWRVARSVSRRAFAKQCGISPHGVSKVEAGDNIHLATLLRVADELELEVLLLPRLFVPAVTGYLQRISSPRKG